MDLQVTTNNVPRLLLDFEQLSPAERADFDYIGEDGGDFFRYRGQVYDLGEMMRTPESLVGWDGYSSDSFFSGIVVRLVPDDNDYVVVGRYCT